MQPHPSSKDYFYRLDTLRFLAFFLVFVNHITDFTRFPPTVGTQGTFFFTFFQVGDLGVGFFFVLSGFLITYLLEKERSRTGKISIKDFYIRRLLRIWPLYFLALAIMIAVSSLFRGFTVYKTYIDWNEIISNIFFVGNIFKAFYHTSNEMIAILWSIAVEEQFYFLWPVIYSFGRRHITYILAFGIAVSMYFRYKYANQFPIREFFTLTVMAYLLIGALAGIHGPKLKSKIAKRPIMITTLSLIGFLALLSVRGFAFTYSYPRWFIAVDGPIFAILFALIILSAAFGGKERRDKNIFSRVTEYLGTVSYGLYIYHLIALTTILYIFQKLGFDRGDLSIVSFLVLAAVVFGSVVLVSSVSYRYFEKPFLKLKARFVPRS